MWLSLINGNIQVEIDFEFDFRLKCFQTQENVIAADQVSISIMFSFIGIYITLFIVSALTLAALITSLHCAIFFSSFFFLVYYTWYKNKLHQLVTSLHSTINTHKTAGDGNT